MNQPCYHFIESTLLKPSDFSTLVILLGRDRSESAAFSPLPAELQLEGKKYAQRKKITFPMKGTFSFESSQFQKIIVSVVPPQTATFKMLGWAKKIMGMAQAGKSEKILVYPSAESEKSVIDALVSALVVAQYVPPSYKTKKKKETEKATVTFAVEGTKKKPFETICHESQTVAEGTNLVRYLATQSGNDLHPQSYIKKATDIAEKEGLKVEFFSFDALKKMGAGAFVAVAQGAKDNGSGILKISYTPTKKPADSRKWAVVGKGITFDTGGNNLKTGSYMFGMHEDMTGSAIALAIVCLAKQLNWKIGVEAYLAITENVLSATSYRPNDVVKTLKGDTIEVIDTDAEGRMVLADTLWLSSQSRPQFITDFATLTGSCLRALGTAYSGIFSNRENLLWKGYRVGKKSGERVWPFPKDKDYGVILKSKVADIKQCRLNGGPDHIEASYFLSTFVPKEIPWIHVDLSAHRREGGLAHIPGEVTGFGVRWAVEMAKAFFGEDACSS